MRIKCVHEYDTFKVAHMYNVCIDAICESFRGKLCMHYMYLCRMHRTYTHAYYSLQPTRINL